MSINRLSSDANLGALIQSFPSLLTQRRLRSRIVVALILIVPGLLAVAFGLFSKDFNQSSELGILAIWLGLIPIVIGVRHVFTPLKNYGETIHLYEDGLVYERSERGYPVRWEQIESTRFAYLPIDVLFSVLIYLLLLPLAFVVFVVISIPAKKFVVTTSNGQRIVISSLLKDKDLLINTIQRRSADARLSGVLARIENGERISFGSILLDAEGLSVSSPRLLWDEVRGITLTPKKLEIRKIGHNGIWKTITLDGVIDLYLLQDAAEHMIAAHR